MAVIKTDKLTKDYGDVRALDGLDLQIDEGELFGFIGPNGAGKTTTIKILTGQTNPTSGSSEVMGIDPVLEPTEVRSKIGILPEREDPPSFMTPREYFRFVADVRGIETVEDRIEEWGERLDFSDRLDTMNMDLSKGEKQKVMITQAFLHEPELVFIDEPLINLDPVIQEQVKTFFTDYREHGNTVFLSTHVMSLAEEVCTRVGILDRGQMVVERDMDEVEDSLTDVFLTEVERFESSETDD
ncbi:MAG: ABC transporter ATP-binding protein [Candidatus Nanohaloarchaea archaeon]|nr:ABC transporter ATP-binding protein [Candidatus Nanohaloarchaea archaeon]